MKVRQICSACKGTGIQKSMRLFSRKCHLCNGTGKQTTSITSYKQSNSN